MKTYPNGRLSLIHTLLAAVQPLLRKQSVALEWALFREGSTHPNAFTIQPEGLLQYMNRHDPAQGNYAIVDLRNPYDGGGQSGLSSYMFSSWLTPLRRLHGW